MIRAMKKEEWKTVSRLFGGWQDTSLWACLLGQTGQIIVQTKRPSWQGIESEQAEQKALKENKTQSETIDSQNDTLKTKELGNIEDEHIEAAVAIVGDFSFWGGKPSKELLKEADVWGEDNFSIFVPLQEEWKEAIVEQFGEKAHKEFRYALKKDMAGFDRLQLENNVKELKGDYTICPIDKDWFEKCRQEEWSRDFVSNYKDYAEFEKKGRGYLILYQKEAVAGASSYTGYNFRNEDLQNTIFEKMPDCMKKGIEIEIVTRWDHRKKGLSKICVSKLILETLCQNEYPSWDARTQISVSLAEKLGYVFDREYEVYEIGNIPNL